MARPNQSRARILEAAALVASERGVSAATIELIAERAGVAKGSVYYNFATKEQVFETLIDEGMQRMLERLDAELATVAPSDSARLAVVRALLNGLLARPHLAKVIVSELFRTDRVWRESLRAHRDLIFERITAALRHDERAASTVDAAALFGATIMVSFEMFAFNPSVTVEEALAAIVPE